MGIGAYASPVVLKGADPLDRRMRIEHCDPELYTSEEFALLSYCIPASTFDEFPDSSFDIFERLGFGEEQGACSDPLDAVKLRAVIDEIKTKFLAEPAVDALDPEDRAMIEQMVAFLGRCLEYCERTGFGVVIGFA